MKEKGKDAVGKKGEDAVCDYLTGLGHTVLDRNWRTGHLEIDIVTLASDGIHFVEVKSRTAPVVADPELNASKAKMRRIANAAKVWLEKKDDAHLAEMEAWLDVAAVVFNGGETEIRYYPGAYTPLYF